MEVGRKQKQKPYSKSKALPLRSGQEDAKVTFCSPLTSPCCLHFLEKIRAQ